MHRPPRRLLDRLHLVAVALAIFSALPLAAQRTTFDPSISLGYFYTSNVNIVGEDGPEDSGYRFGVTFPVRHTTKRSSLAFTYSPYFDRFNDFGELDNTGHRASLIFGREVSRRSSLDLSASYLRVQDQGDPQSEDDGDLLLNRRTQRESTRFDLGFDRQLRNRWRWGFSVGASEWRYDEIEDFEPPEPVAPLEDRKEARGSITVGRNLSERSSFGVRYGYRFFDLEVSGERQVHSASLVWQREVADRLSLSASLGGFWSSGDEFDRGEAGSDTQSGIQGSLNLSRTYRRVILGISASHQPSAGGSRPGTATNSRVQLSLSGATEGPWNWGLYARWARRDPIAGAEPTVEGWSLGPRVSVRFGLAQIVGIGFTATYNTQSGGPQTDEADYFRVAANLSIFPLARTRLGGGR